MTGFVFFVRGEGNALAYVFYPFMPLHIMPEDQVCKELWQVQRNDIDGNDSKVFIWQCAGRHI